MSDTSVRVVEAPVRPSRATFKRKSGKDTKKPKKPKVKTLSKLKKELEILQKLLVIKFYGNDCYTCTSTNLEGKNRQLGHVPWPRTDLSVKAKFDYRYTRIQCMPCNIHRGGAGAKAYARMLQENIDVHFLRETSDNEKGKTIPRAWFENRIAEYQTLLSVPVDNPLNEETTKIL